MEITPKTHVEVKPFKFTGNASEYFRIWIINVSLTILTFGIYSAWAKVRNKRYFYSNTYLDNTTFEYLADPLKILKGRLVVVAVVAVYVGVTTFYPLSELVFLIAFWALLPWLVIKALAFNAINSTYRNIRFNFKANFGEASWIFWGIPLLVVLTLGLAFPYLIFRSYQFALNHSRYGTTAFNFEASSFSFSNIYFKAIGLFILASLVLSLVMNFGSNLSSGIGVSIFNAVLWLFLVIYLGFLAYLKANVTNFVFNHTHLGKLRLESTLQVDQMLWLYFSNAIGIVLSLGLLIPWAKIRMIRYRLANLTLHVANDDLNNFVAAERDKASAIGEEMGDMFDVDIGL